METDREEIKTDKNGKTGKPCKNRWKQIKEIKTEKIGEKKHTEQMKTDRNR